MAEEVADRDAVAVGHRHAIGQTGRLRLAREARRCAFAAREAVPDPLRQGAGAAAQAAVACVRGAARIERSRLAFAGDAGHELIGAQVVTGHDSLDARRAQHEFGEQAVERLARDTFGDQCERLVVGVAVGPARPRRVPARRGGCERDVGRDRCRGLVGELAIALEPEEVREPRGLGEQVRDAQFRFVREPLGQVAADGCVELHLPLVGEREDDRGRELLRDRAEREDRGRRRRGSFRCDGCRRAIALAQHHRVASQHGDVRRRDALAGHECSNRGVGARAVRRGPAGRRGRGRRRSHQHRQCHGGAGDLSVQHRTAHFAGMRIFCPGKILSGSRMTSRLASKISG